MQLRLHVLLHGCLRAGFQRRKIAPGVERRIVRVRLQHRSCDLLCTHERLLFGLHRRQAAFKRFVQRRLPCRELPDLVDPQPQCAQQPDLVQRVEIRSCIIAVAVFHAVRREQSFGFIETDVRARHAGQRFNLTNGHMHPSCPHCNVSSSFTVKSFLQNNRVLIFCKRESGLAGRT